jgi:dihydroorotase
LIPGAIDDQVHFREPGLTHKGDIESEKAAIAGGITSLLNSPTQSQMRLPRNIRTKKRAGLKIIRELFLYDGATNDKFRKFKNKSKECWNKNILGSSTGNMLVDNEVTLEKYFTHY